MITLNIVVPFAFLAIVNYVSCTELYSSRYDAIDIDGILGSERLVTNYVECLLNKRPCTPEGKSLKRVLPEALKSKCARCSPKQKESALKVIRRLHDAYPEKWIELAQRYDPTGDYRKSYEEYLRNEQYNTIDRDEPTKTNEVPSRPVLPEIGTRFNFEESKPEEKPTNEQDANKPAPPVRSVGNTNANTLPLATEKPVQTTAKPVVKPSNPSPTIRPTIFTIQGSFQARPISHQVLGLVSNLGNKVARTAGLVADMLRDTVTVIVG